MIEQIITSSVLIVGVLILSVFLEKRINPCIRYALWLLVAVKLLVPVPEFESNFSVMNVVAQAEEIGMQKYSVENAGGNIVEDAESVADDALHAYDAPVNPIESSDVSTQKELTINRTESAQNAEKFVAEDAATGRTGAGNSGIDRTTTVNPVVTGERNIGWTEILGILWIVGMVLCAGVFLWSNLRFGRALKRSRKPIGRFRDKLNVYRVAGIMSPCLFGLFRPSIYLQAGRELSEVQKEYVCAHEYTHYRHGDHIWAIVRCVCVIVYWFNPLVWVAARASMKDSELACDAGTLKLIGQNYKLEYGRTLVELAGDRIAPALGIRILGCSTGATGGAKEMKKRIQMIAKQPATKVFSLIIMLMACVSIVGCTFGDAVSESKDSEEVLSGEAVVEASDEVEDKALKEALEQERKEAEAVQEEIRKQEAALIKEAASSQSQELIYKDTILYSSQPLYDENKVCIRVQPSALGVRELLSYYYVPSDEDMQWIMKRVRALKLEGQPYAKRWKGMKEKGWQLIYNGWEFMVFEGGYLYSNYDNGTMECLVEDPKLCDYIQIMLQENLNYHSFNPADIRNIESARLDICSVLTNWEFRSQTITDEETLTSLEKLLSESEYIYGGADCSNHLGYLELTLADGETVCLSMATDSCDNFGINGVYYDYHPEPGGDNSLFYGYFDELTAENSGGLQRHISVSLIYSPEEIQEAIEAVEEAFAEQFVGCTLSEITYYESFSKKYADSWATQYEADQALVLTSDIEVPVANTNSYWSLGGTYYDFEWILTRNDGEEWVVQTWRY